MIDNAQTPVNPSIKITVLGGGNATPRNLVDKYKSFGATRCLRLQREYLPSYTVSHPRRYYLQGHYREDLRSNNVLCSYINGVYIPVCLIMILNESLTSTV
jgi:hypothetical protein